MFPHGYTFGGHPVSTAVALANLDIFEREGLNDHVKRQSPALRATLERLYDLPIVGDVRGEGYFYRDRTRQRSGDQRNLRRREETRKTGAAHRVGAVRGRAVLPHRRPRRSRRSVIAPPLISGPAEFDTIEAIVRRVLTKELDAAHE